MNRPSFIMLVNKKTARVMFFDSRGNIKQVVFLAGKPTRLQAGRVGFPGQENHECDISTQKIQECCFLFITCHYYEYLEAFLARIVANAMSTIGF
jgi:hypothetical protein